MSRPPPRIAGSAGSVVTPLPNTPSFNISAKAEFERKLSNYEDNVRHNIIPLTVDEVGACIGKLKRGKASGFDNISSDHITVLLLFS